jgi:nitrogen-specific signal transduction histidine kinase
MLAEPKTSFSGSTENWGAQPFATVKHGHYGLGLPRARSIIEEHQGEFTAHYDSGSLVTTIALPIERAP